MKITNINVTEEPGPLTLYNVSIVLDDIVCIKDITVNLYRDEFVVEYPESAKPINNELKEENRVEVPFLPPINTKYKYTLVLDLEI